jgi:hypothetical protein
MKNLFNSKNKKTSSSTPATLILIIAFLFFFSSQLGILHAQDATLSVQGILKKATGEAVPDDSYSLTFRLYTSPTAPINQYIWMEIQGAVDVVSGIYSTVLGNTVPLDVPFDTDYYLGVTVGATEMTPRIQLTSAPYALSIRGENNKFPSSGQVVADSIDVNGNVLTQQGAPGLNGVNKNGYGFLGDKDSGLYSLAAGQVSLYVNNVEEVKVRPDSVVINGEVRAEDLRLDDGGKVSYNGLNDWRLVETDYFETDAEEWEVYNPTNGVQGAWSNGNGVAANVTTFSDDFAGKALMPTTQGQVFKKQFTLPGGNVAGTYTYVKVVFKYYFLNSWDLMAEEKGWAGFSKTETCTELSLGWYSEGSYVGFGWNLPPAFNNASSFVTSATTYSDQWKSEEMIGRYPSGPNNASFYVIFGHASNEAVSTENFAVGMIEIWVK